MPGEYAVSGYIFLDLSGHDRVMWLVSAKPGRLSPPQLKKVPGTSFLKLSE